MPFPVEFVRCAIANGQALPLQMASDPLEIVNTDSQEALMSSDRRPHWTQSVARPLAPYLPLKGQGVGRHGTTIESCIHAKLLRRNAMIEVDIKLRLAIHP